MTGQHEGHSMRKRARAPVRSGHSEVFDPQATNQQGRSQTQGGTREAWMIEMRNLNQFERDIVSLTLEILHHEIHNGREPRPRCSGEMFQEQTVHTLTVKADRNSTENLCFLFHRSTIRYMAQSCTVFPFHRRNYTTLLLRTGTSMHVVTCAHALVPYYINTSDKLEGAESGDSTLQSVCLQA